MTKGELYTPRSIPVIHDLKPQYYDGYSGENSIPARVSYLPVPYEYEETPQKAVIRLADMWIDPFIDLKPTYYTDTENGRKGTFLKAVPTSLETNNTLTPATIIYIGGGDSDALASTGLAGYIRDAQRASLQGNADAKWYARNIVTVSHPAGSPRTQKDVASSSMRLSAEIVYSAIKQAVKDRSIKADHVVLPDGDIELKNVVLMGSSAGGALATELAAIMKDQCRQLILEEPAAMGEHKNIEWHFLTSGLYGAYKDALRHGINPLHAVQVALEDTRISWTLPEGAPTSWAELLKSFLPTGSNFVDLGRIFRLQPNIKSHGLNAAALGQDTTAEARQQITCPVTLVGSTQSKVVNLFTDRAGFTRRELQQITPESQPNNTEERAIAMMEDLFPKANTRLVAMVPGYAHSGLGRNQKVWEQLLTEIQQINLAA